MRNAFARTFEEFAKQDGRLVLLSGDIGNRMFDGFKAACPHRFYNCGVAEANMISVAAGLAMTGLRPWVYTIASFLVYRPYEQIRIDVAYHDLPVILVGTGSGLSYASNGPTHHCLEDIAIFRSLGRFHIACPGDALEVISCMEALRQTAAPAYLRLGKKNEPTVHTTPPNCEIGRALQMRSGRDIALLSTGNILPEAIEACRLLENRGIDVGHWHFPWVVPVDETVLEEVLSRYSLVVTVEEHSREGGFGSLAAEWFAERPNRNTRLLRLGLPSGFICQTTNATHGRHAHQLDAEGICMQIETAL